uniref:Uncharacterized protein n=1 Tax=Anguilla anguilla TaxID=7936 RepID=A0A0E9X508_ANGAN
MASARAWVNLSDQSEALCSSFENRRHIHVHADTYSLSTLYSSGECCACGSLH